MKRQLAIALSILICVCAFPEAAGAQSEARKVSGPQRTGKTRPSKRSSDVRRVRKTRTVKRHYRRPHEPRESSNAGAANAIFGIFQLVGDIALALEEVEEYESQSEYDETVYADDELYEESDVGSFAIRTTTGAAFRFVDGYYEDSQAGMTYGTRLGLGTDFAHFGLTLDADDYSAFGGPAILMFRPGIDLLIAPIDTGWPVRPIFGVGIGAFFDTGPDSRGAGGVSFDLEGGISFQVSQNVDISLTAQLDILTQPEEDEYGESSLGVVGLRQSLVVGTGFVF